MTVDGNDSRGVKSSAQFVRGKSSAPFVRGKSSAPFVRGWQPARIGTGGYALTFMCTQWLNDNREFICDKDIK